MPSGGNLLDYGIAINFFGNYHKEASQLNQMTDKLNSSLLSLQNLVVGGGLVYGLHRLASSLFSVSAGMANTYANIKAITGSAKEANDSIKWATLKGQQTPFTIDEVQAGMSMLYTEGFAKTHAQREKSFDSIAAFTALRGAQHGIDFSRMAIEVAGASQGNWRSLHMLYGLSKDTIGEKAKQKAGIDPSALTDMGINMTQLETWSKMVEHGKVGTDAYKDAIIGLIGILGHGGASEKMKTIAGVMSNFEDIAIGFSQNLMGLEQEAGTLSNTIWKSMSSFYASLNSAHEVVHNGIVENISSIKELSAVAKGVASILTSVWEMFTGEMNSSQNAITGWIDKLYLFFSDYQNNIAPIILFLYLVKLQVMEFLRGFYDGFTTVFGAFLVAGEKVWLGMAKIAHWLGVSGDNANVLGKMLGLALGTLLGLKAFKFIVSPLTGLINEAGLLLIKLNEVKEAIIVGEGWTLKDSILLRWGVLKEGFVALREAITGATTSAWEFATALLANPITWIVIVVIALVVWLGYLYTHWEEVGQKMQGVSDILLALLAWFVPIIGIPLIMAKYWGDFKEIFMNIWIGIKAYFLAFRLWINRVFIKPIKTWFGDMWDSVKQKAHDFIDGLLLKFPTLVKVFEKIRDIWKSISDFFTNMWDKFVNNKFIGTILSVFKDATSDFAMGGLNALEEQQRKDYIDEHGTPVNTSEAYKKVSTSAMKNGNSGVLAPAPATNNFGNIYLPNVQNPTDFMPQLQEHLKKQQNLQGKK